MADEIITHPKIPHDTLDEIIENYFMATRTSVYEGIRLLQGNIWVMASILTDVKAETYKLPDMPEMKGLKQEFEAANGLKLPSRVDLFSREYDLLRDFQAQKYRLILFQEHAKFFEKLTESGAIDIGKMIRTPSI